MTALLFALAGFATVAYGWTADQAAALICGFLALLFALGLHEIPARRAHRTAPEDLTSSPGELLDFSEATFDWPDRDDQRAA